MHCTGAAFRAIGTGRELPEYRPAELPARHEGGPLPAGVSRVHRVEIPTRASFMTLGHVLLATLLGYIGGRFALAVQYYERRARRRS